MSPARSSTPAAVTRTGTRVMLQPGLNCGSCTACQRGRDNYCADYDVLGYRSDGGYAELVSVPIQNLIPIPDHVAFVEVSAFPLTFLTAWHMLVTRGRVHAGDDVLVLAGGSGVGQAAIQIARLNGARVFATSAPRRPSGRARSAPRSIRSLLGRLRQGHAPPHRRPRRRYRDRACRRGDMGSQRPCAGQRRSPGDLWCHHRTSGRRSISGTSSRDSCRCLVLTWAPRRSCSRRPALFRRPPRAGHRRGAAAGRRRRGARAAGGEGALRQDCADAC